MLWPKYSISYGSYKGLPRFKERKHSPSWRKCHSYFWRDHRKLRKAMICETQIILLWVRYKMLTPKCAGALSPGAGAILEDSWSLRRWVLGREHRPLTGWGVSTWEILSFLCLFPVFMGVKTSSATCLAPWFSAQKNVAKWLCPKTAKAVNPDESLSL